MWPDGNETMAEGACDGVIVDAERGDAGFAYDSLFVPDAGDGRTFAEMTTAEKHAMSHRRQAFERPPPRASRSVVDRSSIPHRRPTSQAHGLRDSCRAGVRDDEGWAATRAKARHECGTTI